MYRCITFGDSGKFAVIFIRKSVTACIYQDVLTIKSVFDFQKGKQMSGLNIGKYTLRVNCFYFGIFFRILIGIFRVLKLP